MTTVVSSRGTATGSGVSFGGTLRSEWIKLRTLRSTWWCYLILVALTIGLAALLGAAFPKPDGTPSHETQQVIWLSAATLGISFGQLVAAVLGALVITGEYGTGMIRSTFAAVPKRLPAVIAKALVLGLTTFVVTLFSLVVAALVSAPLLSGKGVHADFGDGHFWLALVGGAGYVALIGVIALGIGLMVRNSAAGIAAALGLVFLLPIILQIFAGLLRGVNWPANVSAFLPSNAGAKLYAYPVAHPGTAADGIVTLDTWQGLLVLLGWVVVVLLIGGILLKRRDA
jgi:ABC-2 type transport system permease protein